MRAVLLVMLTTCTTMAIGQSAQRAPAPPPVYGSVSGHVTCVDTNQPARLASVALQSIDIKPDPDPASREAHDAPMMRTYQTSLDGSFFIPKVPPGTYYVVIEVPGYLTPIKQFSRTELQKPTIDSLARITKSVPIVTVEASHTATIDTRIERGAELNGTIRYDDGTPLGKVTVTALAKEKQAEKEVWASKSIYTQTDDIGHFRLTGLPSGEYLLQVTLALNDLYVSSVLSDSRSMMIMTGYHLSFYSGDVARKDKAKPMKLEAGEQRDGADLTIPLSKLHRVVGALTEQRSGHVINAGKVTLKFTDGTDLTDTKVDPEDNTFHFDFVPEGEYILSATEARDIVREELPKLPNVTPTPGMVMEKLIREYGSATQPLIVQNDVSGITIQVPPKAARPSPPQ